jgi:hypothetical protein
VEYQGHFSNEPSTTSSSRYSRVIARLQEQGRELWKVTACVEFGLLDDKISRPQIVGFHEDVYLAPTPRHSLLRLRSIAPLVRIVHRRTTPFLFRHIAGVVSLSNSREHIRTRCLKVVTQTVEEKLHTGSLILHKNNDAPLSSSYGDVQLTE